MRRAEFPGIRQSAKVGLMPKRLSADDGSWIDPPGLLTDTGDSEVTGDRRSRTGGGTAWRPVAVQDAKVGP